MIPLAEIPEWRFEEVGPFAQCESLTELFVAANKVLGMEGVATLLLESNSTRESLREAADEIGRAGLKDLAALIRRHARRAKPAPMTFKKRWPARKL